MNDHRPRQRLSRQESHAQTRERLIDAARRRFVQHGFGGASIRDIAEEAGYSQGAFYSNFTSKEAVLLELLRRHMAEEAATLGAILKQPEAAGDILSVLERWAVTLDADVDWSMLALELQLHAQRSPAFAAESGPVFVAYRRELGRLVAALFKRLGRRPATDPAELASAFMALAHGLALQRVGAASDTTGRMIMVFLRAVIDAAPEEP